MDTKAKEREKKEGEAGGGVMRLSCRPNCSGSELCVMETRAAIDPHPHVNYTPERSEPWLLFRYVCVCACVRERERARVSGQSHPSKQRKMDKQWQSKHCGHPEGKRRGTVRRRIGERCRDNKVRKGRRKEWVGGWVAGVAVAEMDRTGAEDREEGGENGRGAMS